MTHSTDCLSPSLLLTGKGCWIVEAQVLKVNTTLKSQSHKSHSFPVMESRLEAGAGGGWQQLGIDVWGRVSHCLSVYNVLPRRNRPIWGFYPNNLGVGRNQRPVHNDYIRITRGFNCGLNPVATKHNKHVNTCSARYLQILTRFANIIRILSCVQCLCPWIFYVRV